MSVRESLKSSWSIRNRRGLALAATLVILVLAALAATGVMAQIDARVGAVQSSWTRMQARALAWSGVQAVAAELGSQRERVLSGATPIVTESWTMPLDQGRLGRIRLVPLASAGNDSAADVMPSIQPDGGKLDVNSATAAMLAKIPGLDQASADRIVAMRPLGGYYSLSDLVTVAGLSSDAVFGAPAAGRVVEASIGAANETIETPLDRWLTVGLLDSNLQMGVGDAGKRDQPRVVLSDLESVETLRGRVSNEILDRVISKAKELASATEIAPVEIGRVVYDACKPVTDDDRRDEAARILLDALSWSDDDEIPGRVDVTRAPREILAAVPGFDSVLADRAVSIAQSLNEDDRESIWWLSREVLSREQFIEASAWLTTRSLQWRVRVEAVIEPDDEEPGLIGSDAGRRSPRNVVRLEAVVDLSRAEPRLMYLRDVTNLEVAGTWAASIKEDRRSADQAVPEPGIDDRPATLEAPSRGDSEAERSSAEALESESPPSPPSSTTDSARSRWRARPRRKSRCPRPVRM